MAMVCNNTVFKSPNGRTKIVGRSGNGFILNKIGPMCMVRNLRRVGSSGPISEAVRSRREQGISLTNRYIIIFVQSSEQHDAKLRGVFRRL